MLHTTQLGLDLFPNCAIVGFRRPKNLKDILTKASLTSKAHMVVTMSYDKCKTRFCDMCKLIHLRNGWIRCTITRATYPIPTNVDCMRSNLVYLISCRVCKQQYVGETKRTLKTRIKEHLADIRHHRQKPVAIHFNTHSEGGEAVIPNILELVKLKEDEHMTTIFRRERERFWMYRLRCLSPLGINVQS